MFTLISEIILSLHMKHSFNSHNMAETEKETENTCMLAILRGTRLSKDLKFNNA